MAKAMVTLVGAPTYQARRIRFVKDRARRVEGEMLDYVLAQGTMFKIEMLGLPKVKKKATVPPTPSTPPAAPVTDAPDPAESGEDEEVGEEEGEDEEPSAQPDVERIKATEEPDSD